MPPWKSPLDDWSLPIARWHSAEPTSQRRSLSGPRRPVVPRWPAPSEMPRRIAGTDRVNFPGDLADAEVRIGELAAEPGIVAALLDKVLVVR